jgi:hypothetical protein
LPPRGRSLSTFDWQGTGERLRVEFPSWVRPLVDTRARPKLGTATVDKEPLAFSFSEGKGRVVVFTSLHFLRNGSIGHEDHAELGWQLATDRGRERGALLALRPVEGASLGEWLRKEAWPVSVAMAILLVLWLLRIVPRFGPLEPDPQPSRRRLGEHIAASGRFLASRGELAWLLDAARERVWQVAARRFAAARARKPETVDALADALGVSRFHAQRAFHMKPVTDEAFIGATSALQSIESRLHGKETK